MNSKWIVARTKPNKENLAYANLIRQGFSVFLPKIKKIKTFFSGSNIILKPLFPGYIFIDISKINWVKINSTFGVKEVLAIDGNPLYVPEKILNLIKSKCDENDIYLKSFYLKKGEKIKLKKGQKLTLDGVFDEFIDFKRSSILVKLLNQQFKIVVENSLIEI